MALPWYIIPDTPDPALFFDLIGRYDFTGNTLDTGGRRNNANIQGTVTPAADRRGTPNYAYTFDGTTGYLSTTRLYPNPTSYSINVWFKTTTTDGGAMVAYNGNPTGTSANNDRIVWMDTSGKINFGVWIGSARYITTTSSYNDNNWHMATATMDSTTGMTLYVDGTSLVTDANTVSQSFSGYWRIGHSTIGTGFPATTGTYFSGTLDDVKIYNLALSGGQVAQLYSL